MTSRIALFMLVLMTLTGCGDKHSAGSTENEAAPESLTSSNLKKARELLTLGQPEQAIPLLDAAIQDEPSNVDVYRLKLEALAVGELNGMTSESTSRLKATLTALEKLGALLPNDSLVAGVAMLHAGAISEVIREDAMNVLRACAAPSASAVQEDTSSVVYACTVLLIDAQLASGDVDSATLALELLPKKPKGASSTVRLPGWPTVKEPGSYVVMKDGVRPQLMKGIGDAVDLQKFSLIDIKEIKDGAGVFRDLQNPVPIVYSGWVYARDQRYFRSEECPSGKVNDSIMGLTTQPDGATYASNAYGIAASKFKYTGKTTTRKHYGNPIVFCELEYVAMEQVDKKVPLDAISPFPIAVGTNSANIRSRLSFLEKVLGEGQLSMLLGGELPSDAALFVARALDDTFPRNAAASTVEEGHVVQSFLYRGLTLTYVNGVLTSVKQTSVYPDTSPGSVAASNDVLLLDKTNQFPAVGTYTSEQNGMKYRELKSDGTCFIQELRGAVTCTYEIDGSQLTIKASNGKALRVKLKANTMVDSDGELWTKK